VPFIGREWLLLELLIRITWPIVVVLNYFSRIISDGKENRKEMTREEMIAVAEIGETQGALEKQETRVIKNLLTLDKILAEDVMTPSTVMMTFHKSDTIKEVIKKNSPIPFSRIPIIDNNLDDIIGVVFIIQIMGLNSVGK
jgi:CBS domain containing-hemolysin-like protein